MKKFLVLMFFGVLFVCQTWGMQKKLNTSKGPSFSKMLAAADLNKPENVTQLRAKADTDLKDLDKTIAEKEQEKEKKATNDLEKLKTRREKLATSKRLLGDLSHFQNAPHIYNPETRALGIGSQIAYLQPTIKETYNGPEEKIVATRRQSRSGLAKQPAKEPVNAAGPDSPRSLASSTAGTEPLGSSVGSQSFTERPTPRSLKPQANDLGAESAKLLTELDSILKEDDLAENQYVRYQLKTTRSLLNDGMQPKKVIDLVGDEILDAAQKLNALAEVQNRDD